MSEADPLVYIYVLKIRATLLERHRSGCDIDLIEFADKIKGENSGYAAHSVGWIVDGEIDIFRSNINGFVFAIRTLFVCRLSYEYI
jgi:hypothetical protein